MDILRALLKFFQSLLRSLCGLRPRDDEFLAEQEGLLSESSVTELSSLEEGRQQSVLVMRHGQRIDEVVPDWAEKSTRPWDPHLTQKGRIQATEVAAKIKEHNITYIISSPFHRCLETSAQILSQLGMTLDHLLVDGELCEIYSPRTLNFGDQAFPTGSVESWMWHGKSMKAAVQSFVEQEPSLKGIPGVPGIIASKMPKSIESVSEACKRYSQAIQRLADTYDAGSILIVTHGEALRASVNRVVPNFAVYETVHTGYTVAVRTRLPRVSRSAWSIRGASKKWNAWHLTTENGATGVSWMC